MPSEKRKLGDICETIAVKHLVKHTYTIIGRNYQKKWGEIDIIATSVSRDTNKLHFIEVKGAKVRLDINVRPEVNMSDFKKKRLWRAIQSWFIDNPTYNEIDWQIDVAAVLLFPERKTVRIRWIRNIIIE